MRRRTVLALALAGVLSVGAAVLLGPDRAGPAPPSAAQLAFPDLSRRLGGAARIEVQRHDATLVLRRDSGDTWTLPALADYPARGERVRELLVGLTELRLSEPRTADPEQLDHLGLADPLKPGATSSLLRVLDADGAALVELVTGRRRVRTQGNLPESIYVRRPAESQAWLAEGRLPVDADPQLWVNRDLANILRERVLRVSAARPDVASEGATADGVPPAEAIPAATELELARAGEVDAPLRVVRPLDPPPLDDAAVEDVGRAFEFLTFLEVRREGEVGGEPVGETRFTLTDNLVIAVRSARLDGQLWVRLAAAGDDEAARLNNRWRGWTYQVGTWKEKAFAPRLEDLIRPERPPTPVAVPR